MLSVTEALPVPESKYVTSTNKDIGVLTILQKCLELRMRWEGFGSLSIHRRASMYVFRRIL